LDPRLRGDDTGQYGSNPPVIPAKLVCDLSGERESTPVIPAQAGIQ
jgi:hypothetical protein